MLDAPRRAVDEAARYANACQRSVVALRPPPRVEVTYVDPDKFTDVRNGYTPTPSARDFYLAELKRFIESRAAPRMADGETLKIAVTNVQLEGDYEARRPAITNVRIVRDVNPARIDLCFRLVRGEDGAREGERLLRTTGYAVVVGVDPSDPLLYVKALLDEWLRTDLPRTP